VNRVFALFFFILIAIQVLWAPIKNSVFMNIPPSTLLSEYINPFNLAFLIVLVGLLYEMYHPTLNFELDKNRKWRAIGIFLFVVAAIVIVVEMFWQPYNPGYSFLGSATFEYPGGSGNFHTLPIPLLSFLNIICMETVSFSLLFGFLFMTKSTPQTSKSYKIMLVGAVALEVLFFILSYLLFFVTGMGMGVYSGLTRMELLTKYWFHWDFWSELVILVSAIWLLKRGKEHLHQTRPWTPQEKRFVSIFIVLALFVTLVLSPLAMGVDIQRVFASLIMFALATVGFILYLRHTEKKKRKGHEIGLL